MRAVRLWPIASTVLALALLVTPPGAADWPQWRGPEGLGVAAAAVELPATWGPESANVRWRTPIPGQGISSPIVVGGRAFVTTAYESRRADLLSAVLRAAAGLLAAVLAFAVWRALARRPAEGRARRDALLVAGGSLVFLLLALALAVKPELFLEAGNPGRMWRVGGTLSLLGLAAAFAWFPPASRWRLVGALALLAGGGLVAYLMPHGPLGPVKLEKKLVAALPGLAFGIWYAIQFRRARARGAAPIYRPLFCLPLLVLAALVFAIPNLGNALDRVVVAVDLAGGEILWETPVFSAPPEQKWDRSTYATPTPATDGERVFAYFGAGIGAVDLDGRVLWVRRFPHYSQHTRYGAGSSPVVAGDAVVVMQESEAFQGGPPSWLGAFDRETGDRRWRIEPPEAHDSYTTPLLVGAGPAAQLLTATWQTLISYDPATGERRWSHPYPMEQLVASMGREGDLVVVSGGVYGDKVLVAFRVSGDGPDARGEVLWESRRSAATIPSPVVYGGRVYTLTDSGILTCYDAASGETLWKQRLTGEYFSSLAAGDGKVYATNTEGATTVFAAGPEFRSLAVNDLGAAVYSSPALSGDCLLLRTARDLYCIDPEGPGETALAGAP